MSLPLLLAHSRERPRVVAGRNIPRTERSSRSTHRALLDKTKEFDGSGDPLIFSKKEAIQIEAKLFDLFGDGEGGKPNERRTQVSR